MLLLLGALPGGLGVRLVLGLGFFQNIGAKSPGMQQPLMAPELLFWALSYSLTKSLISGGLLYAEGWTTTPDCNAQIYTWSCVYAASAHCWVMSTWSWCPGHELLCLKPEE